MIERWVERSEGVERGRVREFRKGLDGEVEGGSGRYGGRNVVLKGSLQEEEGEGEVEEEGERDGEMRNEEEEEDESALVACSRGE